MVSKYFLLFFATFFLVSPTTLFAASEAAAKVEVPKLSEEERKKLQEYRNIPKPLPRQATPGGYLGNLLSYAVRDYKKYPRIVDYLLATQPALANQLDYLGQLPVERNISNALTRKLLEKTDPKVLTPEKLNYMLSQAARLDQTELLPELVQRGADIKKSGALEQATRENKLNTMQWLINHGARDAQGNAIREIRSPEALDMLLNAGADIRELNKDGRWLNLQIQSAINKKANPSLVQIGLEKLKRANSLTSINNKNKFTNGPLCELIEYAIIHKRTTPDSRQKARQIAHILLDYGAVCVCEDPKLQGVLEDIKAERIEFPLQGKEGTIEPNVMGLIHEYTGAKLPTGQPTEAEEKAWRAAQQPTASTSSLAKPSAAESSVKGLHEKE